MVRTVLCRLLGLVISSLVLPANVRAQAWVPPRDEVSVTTSYQYVTVTQHYDWRGREWDRGHIRADSLLLGVEYGITDRLAFSMNVPYVSSLYHGARPCPDPPDARAICSRPHQLPIDDGTRHAAFQDYHIGLRYNIVRGRVVATPFVSLVVPTNNYTYFAHSAVGRDLHEQTVGLSVGVPLDPSARRLPCGCAVPQLYVQGRYAYSFVERVLGIHHNKSNADLDVGYFVSPAALVRILASWQKTHGGVDCWHPHLPCPFDIDNPPDPKSPIWNPKSPIWIHHDQIGAEDYLNLGTGASYTVNDSVDVFLIALRTVRGRNAHKMDLSVTTGIGYSFNGRQAMDRLQRRLIGRN
jgi:hypothetical protein